MIAFDTDVLSLIFRGNLAYTQRVTAIPIVLQHVPIIVAEEIVRGRLDVVRKAEAGQAKISLEQAYHLFEEALMDLQQFKLLPYTAQADAWFQQWRREKVRVATHDLRITAICRAHNATSVSRNRRDYERVPGLRVEFWL
ncbi:MAG: type II toxin-antitoxin system VapC family toxin [Caldilineaceae bacterium]